MTDSRSKTDEVTPIYTLAGSVLLSELDTLIPGEHGLAKIAGRYYQLTGISKAIVSCLSVGELSATALGRELRTRHFRFSDQRLSLVLGELQRLSIVVSSRESVAPEREHWYQRFLHKYFTIRIVLLPPGLCGSITRRMGVIFRQGWWPAILIILFLVQAWFSSKYGSTIISSIANSSLQQLVWIAFGNYLALFLHELGHAAACRANEIKDRGIGVCLYIVFPAFYADVSEAWTLSRSGRAMVDAGGILTTLICSSVCSFAYLCCGEPVLGTVAMLCNITVAWNLNPFIRMDGYWLVSDWLGVQNLMSVNGSVSLWILGKVVGRPVRRPNVLSAGYSHRLWYLTYYALFVVATLFMTAEMALTYLPEIVRAYPATSQQAIAAMSRGADLRELSGSLLRWLGSTLTLIGSVGFLMRMGIAFARSMRRLRDLSNEPGNLAGGHEVQQGALTGKLYNL